MVLCSASDAGRRRTSRTGTRLAPGHRQAFIGMSVRRRFSVRLVLAVARDDRWFSIS